MHQRSPTLLPAAALLVALVPQVALAPPGVRPPGRTLNAMAAAHQHTAMPATTSQPTLGFTVGPTTVGPGEQVVLAGVGCRPGEQVHFQWRPYPRTASVAQLAPATARGDGSFRRVWRVPPRSGRIAVSAWCGRRYSHEVVVTLLGRQAPPTSRPDALPLTGSGNALLLVLAGALLAVGVGALWVGRTRSARGPYDTGPDLQAGVKLADRHLSRTQTGGTGLGLFGGDGAEHVDPAGAPSR